MDDKYFNKKKLVKPYGKRKYKSQNLTNYLKQVKQSSTTNTFNEVTDRKIQLNFSFLNVLL